jgi:hypothetical protein
MKSMFFEAIAYFVAFAASMLVPVLVAQLLPVQYWPALCVLSGWFLAPVLQEKCYRFLASKFLK